MNKLDESSTNKKNQKKSRINDEDSKKIIKIIMTMSMNSLKKKIKNYYLKN